MADIVERLREQPTMSVFANIGDMVGRLNHEREEAANEIERLREIVNELLPHALFLLTQMEDGLSKDPKLLRDRIQKACAALEENK